MKEQRDKQDIADDMNSGFDLGTSTLEAGLRPLEGTNAYIIGVLSGTIAYAVGAILYLCPSEADAESFIQLSIKKGQDLCAQHKTETGETLQ